MIIGIISVINAANGITLFIFEIGMYLPRSSKVIPTSRYPGDTKNIPSSAMLSGSYQGKGLKGVV